jgi:transporter family-2 protein
LRQILGGLIEAGRHVVEHLAGLAVVGGLGEAASAPKWLWLGALLGTFIVFTITVASPRIGTTATIALLVAGQLAMGAAIDKWGLFGFERIALSWPRALGIALLAAGAALTLKR